MAPDRAMLASRVAQVAEHWDHAQPADRPERRGATLLRAAEWRASAHGGRRKTWDVRAGLLPTSSSDRR
jgi:hypothetical protein